MKKSHFFKIQILILLMVRGSLILSRIFCGHFDGQKCRQKPASATSNFLTSACCKTQCNATEGTGQAISIEIYGELGEKSLVLDCYVLAVQEHVRPAHGIPQARFLRQSLLKVWRGERQKNALPVPSCCRYTDLM